MQDAFKKLEESKKNNVESIVNWCKDSKIIDKSKEAQEKLERMFDDAADKSNVEFVKFQEVLTQVAEEKKQDVEQLKKQLVDTGPRLKDAFKAGFSAFTKALQDKKQ